MTETALRTFVFDTTTAALWAEEVATEAGIPAEVVPAPADSDAKCDLALVTREEDGERLSRELQTAGVTFRPWPPQGPAQGPAQSPT